jgi:hypothetical protein
VFLRWVLGAYVAILLLEVVIPRPRFWGRITDSNNNPVAGIRLKLTNPLLPGVIFGSALTREDGRFFLRANPGKYLLEVLDDDGQATLSTFTVRVGQEGVYSGEFVIRAV